MQQFKPILFSTPMVQAIFAGKTQTRRILKGTALQWLNDGFTPEYVADPGNSSICPYGSPGIIHWVRETFCKMPEPDSFGNYLYKASEDQPYGKWKPGIHMPKEACRIFLPVKRIWPERLEDISEADAVAEGIRVETCKLSDQTIYLNPFRTDNMVFTTAKAAYLDAWEILHGKQSRQANPWLWAIEYTERIERPAGFFNS